MYIFLICLIIIMPLLFLVVGLIFYKFPPKYGSIYSGYRTSRSKKNIEIWNEANKYSAKLLITYSCVNLLSVILLLLIFRNSSGVLTIIVLLSLVLSTMSILLMVLFTENHLKNTYKL
jgi:uncharacterized membrane protein